MDFDKALEIHRIEKIKRLENNVMELKEKLEMAKTTIQRLLDHIAENERYEMELQRERWETELERVGL